MAAEPGVRLTQQISSGCTRRSLAADQFGVAPAGPPARGSVVGAVDTAAQQLLVMTAQFGLTVTTDNQARSPQPGNGNSQLPAFRPGTTWSCSWHSCSSPRAASPAPSSHPSHSVGRHRAPASGTPPSFPASVWAGRRFYGAMSSALLASSVKRVIE